jgi:hypothetical protein
MKHLRKFNENLDAKSDYILSIFANLQDSCDEYLDGDDPMRYKFNESLSNNFFLDLREFCFEHLAFLLDEDNFFLDFDKISIGFETRTTHIDVMIKGKRPFIWKDVSDYVIPFILSLDKKYCLTETSSYFGRGKVYIKTTSSMSVKVTSFDIQHENYQHYLSISDIEKDNVKPDTELEYINLRVAGYKA